MNNELVENNRKKSPSELWRLVFLAAIVIVSMGLVFIAAKINYADISRFKTIAKPFMDEILSISNDQRKAVQLGVTEEAVINAELANFRSDSAASTTFFLKAHDALTSWGSKCGIRALIDISVAGNYLRWNHPAQAEKFYRIAVAELPDYASAALRIVFVKQLVTTLVLENKNPEERLVLCEENVQQANSLYVSDPYYESLLVNTLESLGYAYELQQKYELSRQTFQHQVQLTEANSHKDTLRYGESLMELGRVELACDKLQDAEDHLYKAQSIFERTTTEEKSKKHTNDYLVITEYLRCQILERQGKFDQAATIIKQAIDLSKVCKFSMAADSVKLSRIDRIRFDLARSEADLNEALTICFNDDRSDIEQELAVVCALSHQKTESLRHLSRCLANYSTASMNGCNISVSKNDFVALNESKQVQEQVISKQNCSHYIDISNFDPPGYFLTGAQFTQLISGDNQSPAPATRSDK